ncbi:MAG: aminofutalosine synthase MqnE [Nitratiruptor sp.]|nr:aminofutalosine synthase MqnE [Nitratiruptor sp.]NPA84297.1 aminofutalosine synthase MqnE [Campylobacterota bacterium]
MDILTKLERGERLDFKEALALYDLDLFTLGHYASMRREALHGKKSYFNINRHINPTNICKDICKFCAFSAHRKNPNPYTMSHQEIMAIVEDGVARGVKEFHIVSAHNDQVDLEWYLGIFRKIKERFPQVHIKALTAAEVNFLAKEHGLQFGALLDLMIESGVDSMPGGGAEIFDEKIRAQICKGKVSSQEWLEIHRLWHQRGRKSNATMLFGHIEERSHRIDHILRIRALQDETGGFNCFIPLVYQTQNNYLNVPYPLTGQEYLKTIAIARILLDNIPHIKAYWASSTLNLALVAQEFGADDLDGTIEQEAIQSAAGAKSRNGVKVEELVHLIRDSGFIPVERDSLYNELKVWT